MQDNEPLFNEISIKFDETENFNQKPRAHLGASVIGGSDDRKIWLNYRWCLSDSFSPRVLRLFNLGNILEDEVIHVLKKIPGVIVYESDKNNNQFGFSELGGHFAGSFDGVITGVPGAEKTPHILEIKSANEKEFKKLQKLNSYELWKKQYNSQLQIYMGAAKLDRALVCVYCKNNSEMYFERVKIDKMAFPSMIAKAERIITAIEPPESSYPNEQYYEARYMSDDNQAVYWGKQKPAKRHCRNCKHSIPILEMEDAVWVCQPMSKALSRDDQLAGCQQHEWLSYFEKV